MPAIHHFRGLRVVVYPNDHRPPHVHVIGGGHEAIVHLNCPNGPPEVRDNYGFSAAELRTIASELARKLTELCFEWEDIHGYQ